MSKLKRFGVHGYGRQDIYKEDDGEFVLYEDYAALEARVKELEPLPAKVAELERRWEFRTPTLFAYDASCAALAKHRKRADDAEAELARLKAQDPSEYQYYYHNHGTGTGEWQRVANKQLFEEMRVKRAGDNDFSFRELFTRALPAEPLPPVLPTPVDTSDLDRNSKDPEDISKVAECDGWNTCVKAAIKLGCQPQRTVVKLMGEAVVFEHAQNGIAEYGMLPNGQKVTSQFAAGWNMRGERDKTAIRAAGGETAE